MSDNGKIIGALLLGAAAGAALGLLFAPSSGEELRKKIKDNTGDLMDELTDKINEGKEMLSGLKEKAVSKAEDLKSKAEGEFNNVKDKVRTNTSQM
jgi:gas vesicle protein